MKYLYQNMKLTILSVSCIHSYFSHNVEVISYRYLNKFLKKWKKRIFSRLNEIALNGFIDLKCCKRMKVWTSFKLWKLRNENNSSCGSKKRYNMNFIQVSDVVSTKLIYKYGSYLNLKHLGCRTLIHKRAWLWSNYLTETFL